MNTISAAGNTDSTALLKRFSELFPEHVVPKELVRFAGNPISEHYFPCPAPTTPNVTFIEDIGGYTLLGVTIDGVQKIVPRPNEAIPMPLAYSIVKTPKETVFECVFRHSEQLYHAIFCIGQKGWVEAFTENLGTSKAHMSPLGLDLLMRSAISDQRFFAPLFKIKDQGTAETYGVDSDERMTMVIRGIRPRGDVWNSYDENGKITVLITYNNKRGY